ncbi:MAG: replicative DNA helicase, partial [Cyanobacteria bacterium REEB65]|nr:replicative DNA helicase [Cyanobacteria bacterium REEB65]
METAVRIPPQNQDAEQNVLGAMLLSGDAIGRVVEILQIPGAFYRQSHQVVFDAIRDLFERGQPVDLVTVAEFLESRGKLDEVGGRLFLADLLNSVATAANVEHWARIVAQKATLRALILAATEIQAMGYAEDEDVETILDEAEKKIFEVAQRRSTQEVVHIERMLHDAFVR